MADNVRMDVNKMQDWKEGIVKKLTGGIKGLFRGNGVDLLYGEARFVSAKQVEVKTREGGTETIDATKAIVIATGSSTIELPTFKFDGKQLIGARDAVSLRNVPKRLLVIGGGVIGLELGTVYQKLGAELTVVEATASLLPGTDPDLTAVVEKKLVKHGAKIFKNAKAMGYEKQADGSLAVRLDLGGGKFENVICDVVLTAVGMRPNSAGPRPREDRREGREGFIPTDSQGRTNVPGIYCIGDVSGFPMLAHKATKEGEVIAEVIAGHKGGEGLGLDPRGDLHRSGDRRRRPLGDASEGEGRRGPHREIPVLRARSRDGEQRDRGLLQGRRGQEDPRGPRRSHRRHRSERHDQRGRARARDARVPRGRRPHDPPAPDARRRHDGGRT